MRKKITLLTLFALGCISYSAMAQSTEQVEMKSRISRERTDGDGNKTYVWEYEYLDNYYYNKEGKNVLYTRYMLEPAAGTKESLYEQTFYEYNSLGQLTKELQKYTDYGYEYDGNGLLVKKSQTGKGGEQMNSWEYTYNKDNQVTEELEKYNGTPNGKTVYRYNTSKQLAVKLVYEDQYPVGFVVKDSIIYTYKNGNIDTRFTYRYPAEGATEPYEKVYNEWKNGTLVADSVYTVDNFDGDTELKPTETKLRPTEKNYYTYDASGKLLSKKSYSYNSQTNNFSVPKGESLYTLNKIGAGYIATGLKVEGTDKPGSVKLTFKAPVQTEGLQGYKVVIDGQLKDDLMIDKSKTEYILEGQTRGEHVYCLVSVYNEIAANMTEEARYSVEINLPQPTNIRLSAYEKTMFGWEITAVWNKPEIPENLHFKNYAVKVVYPTYELPNTTATNQYKFSYYANKDGEEMEIQVATVYEEGTSDYVSFKQPLWENNQLTAHWHNSGKTVKNADGSLNSSIHYYYMANGSSEKLYAEVQCGSTGSPREKITKVVDEAGEEKAVMHYVWNESDWVQDKKITYETSTETGMKESKTTYTADEKGTFNVVVEKEVYTYDDGSCGAYDLPAKTEYKKLDQEGNLTVSSVATHKYVNSADWSSYDVIDSLYAADGTTLTGKVERDYIQSSKNFTKKSVYTYQNNSYVPVSKFWTEFSEETGLPEKEITQEYKNKVWADKQVATFTASSAYHQKREISGVKATKADGKIVLTWVAPARTDSLESYKILINDVEKETVPATTLTAEYANLSGGYTYRFRVIGIFKGMESTLSTESSVKVAIPAYATIKELKEGYSVDYKGSVNLTGEALVTGIVSIGMSHTAYIADETGAIKLSIIGISPFKKGDKISNLNGSLEVINGLYILNMSSPSQSSIVSSENTVTPVLKTVSELKDSYDADQSKYIKIENAEFKFDAGVALIQNEESLELYLGAFSIDPATMDGHTVTALGYVTLEQNGYGMVINEASDIVDGISTVTANAKLYYANGEVVAEGADRIELYDVAGRQLGVSDGSRISVSYTGTLIVKATYNREVKISKITVK